MLIDTNVWSELSKPRPNAAVIEWMARNFEACILSTIVLAEIRYGIALATDGQRRDVLQTFHDDLIDKLCNRIVPFDDDAASAWGPLRARLKQTGALIGERDMLIAAHALALGVPLVTRNVADMERTGVVIINPWQP